MTSGGNHPIGKVAACLNDIGAAAGLGDYSEVTGPPLVELLGPGLLQIAGANLQ